MGRSATNDNVDEDRPTKTCTMPCPLAVGGARVVVT